MQTGRQTGRKASKQAGREGRKEEVSMRKNEEWVKGRKKSVHTHNNFTTSRQL